MLIRVEIPIDAPGIDTLLRQVFGDESADRVRNLREDGLLTLGVVATDDEGQVVGYVAFSPVMVAGEDRQWVALSPLAVKTALRGQGIGKQLVYEGLDSLNEFGYSAVVTLGSDELYQHLGFQPAAPYGIRCAQAEMDTTLQIYPLAEDALNGVHGLVEYAEYFKGV